MVHARGYRERDKMTLYVYCTFTAEKLHKWDGAKEVSGVEFLANLHRHLFHFKVGVEVKHDNREVEFILLKRELEKEVKAWGEVVGSCEMMVEKLYTYLQANYPQRKYLIEVSEDSENGANYQCDNSFGSGNKCIVFLWFCSITSNTEFNEKVRV